MGTGGRHAPSFTLSKESAGKVEGKVTKNRRAQAQRLSWRLSTLPVS